MSSNHRGHDKTQKKEIKIRFNHEANKHIGQMSPLKGLYLELPDDKNPFGNFHTKFYEVFENYCLTKYPDIAIALFAGVAPTATLEVVDITHSSIVNLPVALRESTMNNMNKCYVNAYIDTTRKQETQIVQIFGDMLACLSYESKSRVTNHPDYPDIKDNHNALALWFLIKELHSAKSTTNNSSQQIIHLQTLIFNYKKESYTDIGTFTKHFKSLIKDLKDIHLSIGRDYTVPESENALSWLTALKHDPAYESFVSQQRFLVNSKVKVNYETIEAQFDYCIDWMDSQGLAGKVTSKPSGGSSFATYVDDGESNESEISMLKDEIEKLTKLVNATIAPKGNSSNSNSFNSRNGSYSDTFKAMLKTCQRCLKPNADHNSRTCKEDPAPIDDINKFLVEYKAEQKRCNPRYKGSNAVNVQTSNAIVCGPNEVMVLMDSGSEINVIAEGIVPEDAVELIDPIPIKAAFGPGTEINKRAFVKWLPNSPILISDQSNINILSLQNVRECCDTTEDADRIIMHTMSHGDIVFERNDKLFYGKMNKDLFKAVCAINVERKIADLSEIKYNQVCKSKKLIEALFYPPLKAIKKLMTTGNIICNGITEESLDLAYNLYGEFPARVKGTLKHEQSRRSKTIVVPPELKCDQQGHMDIMDVNGLNYLVTVFKPSNLTCISDLTTMKTEDICAAIVEQVKELSSYGFSVSKVFTDHGPQMVKLKQVIKHHIGNLVIDISSAGDYIPVCDKKISKLKEHYRCRVSDLPYLPPISWTGEFLRSSVSVENILRYCEGSEVSARVALTQMVPDSDKFLGLNCGDYCEVPRDNQSSNDPSRPRSISAIAMRAVNNSNQSWRFINLETNRIIERSHWVRCEFNEKVIRRVNEIRESEQKSKIVGLPNSIPNEEVENDIVVSLPNATDDVRPLCVVPETGVNPDVNSISTNAVSLFVAHLSYKKSVNEFGDVAIASGEKEINSIIAKGVVEYVTVVPNDAELLSSFMFMKQKTNADGENTEVKGRYTVNGSTQTRIYEDNFSPVLTMQALKMIIAGAAAKNYELSTADVGTAYLNADMDANIYIRAPKEIAAIFAKVDPKSAKFIRKDGSLFMKLKKALYGCRSSAKLWNEEVTRFLLSIGFVQNDMDRCVFNRKMESGGVLTLGIVVDDFIICSPDVKSRQWFIKKLVEKYKQIKSVDGTVLNFIGFKIERDEKFNYSLSMCGFSKDIVSHCFGETSCAIRTKHSPATDRLFDVDVNLPLLSIEKQEWYHSVCAKLLYLANHLRPDLSLAVSFLVTRVNKVNQVDVEKLFRVCEYLNDTVDMVLRIGKSSPAPPILEAFIDASFGNHLDGKSHTGMLVNYGNCPILWKSVKQKLVAKDSTEAELIALSDRVRDVIWCKNFLIAQGEDVDHAVTTYQDNTSTIHLVSAVGKELRTKHLRVRQNLVKELEHLGEIKIKYLPTIEMVADMLTKPLCGSKFKEMVQSVMGDDTNPCAKTAGVRYDLEDFVDVM